VNQSKRISAAELVRTTLGGRVRRAANGSRTEYRLDGSQNERLSRNRWAFKQLFCRAFYATS